MSFEKETKIGVDIYAKDGLVYQTEYVLVNSMTLYGVVPNILQHAFSDDSDIAVFGVDFVNSMYVRFDARDYDALCRIHNPKVFWPKHFASEEDGFIHVETRVYDTEKRNMWLDTHKEN